LGDLASQMAETAYRRDNPGSGARVLPPKGA